MEPKPQGSEHSRERTKDDIFTLFFLAGKIERLLTSGFSSVLFHFFLNQVQTLVFHSFYNHHNKTKLGQCLRYRGGIGAQYREGMTEDLVIW